MLTECGRLWLDREGTVTFGFLISKQVRRVCSDLGRALPPSVNLTVQGKGGAHLGFQRFRGVLCVSMANCFLVKEAMPVAAFALRRGGGTNLRCVFVFSR